eukprot:jgi/Botrbrau1/227/Bobra.0022s0206.1
MPYPNCDSVLALSQQGHRNASSLRRVWGLSVTLTFVTFGFCMLLLHHAESVLQRRSVTSHFQALTNLSQHVQTWMRA